MTITTAAMNWPFLLFLEALLWRKASQASMFTGVDTAFDERGFYFEVDESVCTLLDVVIALNFSPEPSKVQWNLLVFSDLTHSQC